MGTGLTRIHASTRSSSNLAGLEWNSARPHAHAHALALASQPFLSRITTYVSLFFLLASCRPPRLLTLSSQPCRQGFVNELDFNPVPRVAAAAGGEPDVQNTSPANAVSHTPPLPLPSPLPHARAAAAGAPSVPCAQPLRARVRVRVRVRVQPASPLRARASKGPYVCHPAPCLASADAAAAAAGVPCAQPLRVRVQVQVRAELKPVFMVLCANLPPPLTPASEQVLVLVLVLAHGQAWLRRRQHYSTPAYPQARAFSSLADLASAPTRPACLRRVNPFCLPPLLSSPSSNRIGDRGPLTCPASALLLLLLVLTLLVLIPRARWSWSWRRDPLGFLVFRPVACLPLAYIGPAAAASVPALLALGQVRTKTKLARGSQLKRLRLLLDLNLKPDFKFDFKFVLELNLKLEPSSLSRTRFHQGFLQPEACRSSCSAPE
ncbi:hypothetical protein GALMADRAFT_145330 [Galerina marginata CBS 339.88]|uniref:Uncharacterized protein n=1 Tax=Galerina marginata (strain CBS 339.88) TaxID=685588 RepID=A0A067SF75_GALM3|nr:hypothetical protein GALMADRAFT_145330 [Galerina marginata CBS 339.88]